MPTGTKKNNYLKQAGILAAAGILCRIIGILYRSPLTGIIGDLGNGFYTSAYNIYTIILLISSYSIPSAISRLIASKLALKEYENAHRIFKCALLYVLVIGGIASLFTFFGAGLFLEGEGRVVLRVFAPTIFVSGFVGVMRGYFQAHGSMVQTSISQIVEQILNAVVSIAAAYLLISLVTGADATTQAVYGAAGSAIGTGSGVLIALLFMLLVYMLNKKTLDKRRRRDSHRHLDPYGEIFRIILSTVTPILLSTFIYNLSTSLNQVVFTKFMIYFKGADMIQATTDYGVFAGKAMVIINIPIAIASSLSAAMIPAISGSSAVGDHKETHRKVSSAILTTMLIAIPSGIGLFALARPVMQLLFPQKEYLALASQLLMLISLAVIFYSLSTLSNGILQGIGKVNLPVRNASIALLAQTILLVVLLALTDLGIYALVICLLVYSGLMCILNSISVRKHVGFKEDLKTMFLMPFLCAAVMGLVAKGSYELVYFLSKSNVISLIPAILFAVIAYFVLALVTKTVKKEQLLQLPKGRSLVSLGQKLHLIK